MRLTLVTAPTDDPLTLEEVKVHLRVTHGDEDVLIATLSQAAAHTVEQRIERQLLTATWKLELDCFPAWEPYWDARWGGWGRPGIIEVPRPPLQSVTSIKYLDTAGVEQTWPGTDYVVQQPSGPYASAGRIMPAVGKAYPDTAPLPGAVRIEFVAGYGATEVAVPVGLKQAMLMYVGNWYEHREASVVGQTSNTIESGVEALLAPFTRWRVAFA